MAIKHSLGRLDVDLARFAAEVERQGFRWLDIRNEHLLTVARLPQRDDHRDPETGKTRPPLALVKLLDEVRAA